MVQVGKESLQREGERRHARGPALASGIGWYDVHCAVDNRRSRTNAGHREYLLDVYPEEYHITLEHCRHLLSYFMRGAHSSLAGASQLGDTTSREGIRPLGRSVEK